jgi:hypothetical protein
MATCLDYAKISAAVYNKGSAQYYADPPGHMVDDWQVHKWEGGSFFGNGFQGGIWISSKDVVVGCCGTNPDQPGKFLQDLYADIKIGLSILPNQTYSAQRMVRLAKSASNGRRVSITGHSLGGGLAQVVALWENIPFVTFNAPAMKRALTVSQVNIAKPDMMIKTLSSGPMSDSPGINFRVDGDIVSSKLLGDHLGTIVKLPNPKAMHVNSAHKDVNFWQSVMNTDWAFIDPFEAL